MDKYNDILALFRVTSPVGYSAEDIARAKAEVGALPFELEGFFLKYGASPELHGLQDELILPNRYKALLNPEYIVFFNENQGVCQAAVKKSDALITDPPVYTSDDNGGWKLSSPHFSEFLYVMFGYQASLCLDYSPEEFYWITPEEKAEIEKMFPKLGGFDNWLYNWNVTVYRSGGGRVSLMENGGDIQMSYAANSECEFDRIKELLDGVGEAI